MAKKLVTKKDIERAQLKLEYKHNIVKWAEECVYLPIGGEDRLCKLYEPQKKVLIDFQKHHFLTLLKSRQTGFSTLSQIIVAHISTFYKNVVMGIISRDGSESSDFNRKVIDILEKQPKWLRPSFNHNLGGFKNAQSFKTTDGCQLWSSAVSPANPGAVFRGKTLTLLIIDEAAHIRNIDEAWTGIAMSLSKAQADAKIHGIPYGTIILSTPNRTQGIGKWYFERWQQASMNPNGVWKPHKIHWKEIPLFRDDPNWYKQQCEILENNPKKIAQELELQFVPAGGIFPEEVYQKLQILKSDIKEKVRINSDSFIWRFDKIHPHKFYLIGVDTASEYGADWSAIQVFDYITMDQVLEFRGNLSVKAFVNVLKMVVGMIKNNVLLVENNSYGNQVCEELYLDNHRTYNIYGTWKAKTASGATMGKSSKLSSSKAKKRVFIPGINTNTATRPLIMDALYKYVTERPEAIKSERLAMELISLIDKSNKIQADEGSTDDLALAYGFCCYARHYLKETMMYANNPIEEENEDEQHNWMAGMNSNDPMKGIISGEKTSDSINKQMDRYLQKNYHKVAGQSLDIAETLFPSKGGKFPWDN